MNTPQIHANDREIMAKNLSLSLAEFDTFVASANHAYEKMSEMGPFYGKEENNVPTFRIPAEPVTLSSGSKELLTFLGNDILHLAKALTYLPEEYKNKLGTHIDFRIPPTWRVDAILKEDGELRVNEIEGLDGHDALMMAEQVAYGLHTLEESTAAVLIPTLKTMCLPQKDNHYKIAYIRKVTPYNPHIANDKRFMNFIATLSKGSVTLELIDKEDLRSGTIKPDWSTYAGVINQSSLTYSELKQIGVPNQLVLSSGNYNAIVNKGVLALVFDISLRSFWQEHLGSQQLERLKNILIPSRFVTNLEELQKARKDGKVVKISWAGSNTELINRSNGVAIPNTDDKHGDEERWNMLKMQLEQGAILIEQDFVMPARVPAYLRKKGISLEHVNWYNRVCIKYVCESDPDKEILPPVALTATEITLGPDIVPAGRLCAFTAVKLI